jgi:hypothetical protein
MVAFRDRRGLEAMKILLLLAASRTDPLRRNDPFMPLSLPLLAATAPGHTYTLVDLLWDDDVDTAMDVDLVGISMRLTGENRAYAIADAFRRRGVKVVIGGPQASAVPIRVREHADAVAVGEGEPLWPTIVEDVARGTLKDFYVCSPVPFVLPSPESTLHQVDGYADLSALPVARRELYRRSYRFDTVFAMRGCPIDCDFCAVPSLFGRRFRTRPAADVAAEIDTFRNYYYLLDDTVFGKAATYDYYLDLYARVAGLKKRRFWCGQGNLDAVGDEKGRAVIQAGCVPACCTSWSGWSRSRRRRWRPAGRSARWGCAAARIRCGAWRKTSAGCRTRGWWCRAGSSWATKPTRWNPGRRRWRSAGRTTSSR